MTREEISNLEKASGLAAWWESGNYNKEEFNEYLSRFAALVAALAEPTINEMETVWNEYPIDTDTTRGPMLMTVGDTLSRAGFIKKQEPLPDEHLTALCRQHWDRQANILDHIAYARAIEQAHGIGDEE